MGVTLTGGHYYQASTDGYYCLQIGTECILLYYLPCHQLTPFNYLVGTEGDMPAVQKFKRTVAAELEKCFTLSSDDTARTFPVLCAAVDPRYSHLRFLKQNRET